LIKKILVPVDFSESSLNALDTAIQIAGTNKALLQILHVSDESTDATVVNGNERHIFDAMAGSILQKHGILSEILFMEGFVGPTIVKTAFLNKPDLIVMGAHGASGFRELFAGSNTYYVIKSAVCPVLMIPEHNKWPGFHKIVYPARTTFGALQRYEFVKNLVSNKSSSLEFLGLGKDNVEAKAFTSIADQLKREQSMQLSVSFSHEKNIAREILDYSDRMNADLIVISPAIDAVNKQFFVGPFSQRIVNHAKVPVLYINK